MRTHGIEAPVGPFLCVAAPDPASEARAAMEDASGRRMRYLRISVIDACNYRCVYCLPSGWKRAATTCGPLSASEIRNLVDGFAGLGICKVRLTGGEPLLRHDIVSIARSVAAVPGILGVGISTNGFDLARLAEPLRKAGVSAVNISVDSLDPVRYGNLTGRPNLGRILDGLFTALRVGFETVKVNTVLLRETEESDLERFFLLAREHPIAVRFIELMPTRMNRDLFKCQYISAEVVRTRLSIEGWSETARYESDGPAREYVHPEYRGRVGIISPNSCGFCATCNRIRVSSDGRLRLCLYDGRTHPLRPWIQSPSQRDDLHRQIREAVSRKPEAGFPLANHHDMVATLAQTGG